MMMGLPGAVRQPLDDAVREGLPAIMGVLKVHGGLSGRDPSLRDKLAERIAAKKTHLDIKALRREEARALGAQRSDVLQRLLDIYTVLAEHLPTLAKYTNLVSTTLKSRRSASTVDRSPKPDLMEARTYFYKALTRHLEKVHKAHYEAFLTLVEDYAEARSFEERAPLAAQLLDRFLDTKSAERLHFHPNQVAACKEQHAAALRARELPDQLFDAFRLSVSGSLAELLPEFYRSEHFLQACAHPNGVLWRVMKLSRLVFSIADLLLERAVEPFLTLCDRDDALSCVPHYSPQSRATFRAEFLKLKASGRRTHAHTPHHTTLRCSCCVRFGCADLCDSPQDARELRRLHRQEGSQAPREHAPAGQAQCGRDTDGRQDPESEARARRLRQQWQSRSFGRLDP
jgi:hypothetical protein